MVVPCPSGCKEFSHIVRHDCTQLHVLSDTRRKTYRVDRGTYIDSALREIYDVYKAARSAFRNRDGGLADRVLKDTTITKRAARLLEQVSLLSDGDYKQSRMLQLSLDCVDRETDPTTAFVSSRERPMLSEDNQTLSLRVVDPIADDGVWAIIDDGCNSGCLGEVWRQNAEIKMKVFGSHPIWLHREATTFNGVGPSTTSGKLKIPIGFTLYAVSLFWSRVPLFDDLLSLAQSTQTCSLHIIPFPVEGLGWQWMSRTPRPRSPLWTPMKITSTTFGILCWDFFVTRTVAYSWKRFLMRENRTFLSFRTGHPMRQG